MGRGRIEGLLVLRGDGGLTRRHKRRVLRWRATAQLVRSHPADANLLQQALDNAALVVADVYRWLTCRATVLIFWVHRPSGEFTYSPGLVVRVMLLFARIGHGAAVPLFREVAPLLLRRAASCLALALLCLADLVGDFVGDLLLLDLCLGLLANGLLLAYLSNGSFRCGRT